MATTNSRASSNGAAEESGARTAAIHAMSEAQERLRAGAEQVAEKLPDAIAGAQVAARDTQRALDDMDEKTLLAGASFAVGLAVGLFFAGVNRIFVLLALAPAAAMAATLFGRNPDADTAKATATRKRSAAQTEG